MSELTARSFFELTSGRRGHFRVESGHHSELWFDLDGLFAVPARVEPFVAQLADSVRLYDVNAICGPLLGGAFLAQLLAHALGLEFCFTERVMAADAEGLYRARYRLPPAFAVRVRDQRLAIVDDVMSAGSALRGSYSELKMHGGTTVMVGALLVLGDVGAAFFGEEDVAVEAVVRDSYSLWLPSECPLCVAGMPLEDVAAQAQ